ncbi:unnamed protein product [Darwinula stevensoni]|uniref:Biogenesis of lysosome-related organelles complex 1 subunit 6 n=1 Tax=Darwinula stevensoni TaxID=69355 RepID=A0A7R8ZZ94_9CRUS|nr:unnamed protein product [Darwinula stevensoni]CAG0883114.1 unnamed protein product [Darwinula stevensoni]
MSQPENPTLKEVEDLTNGICAEYEPTVIRLEATLTELLKNQEVVIDSLEEENRRFTEVELESQQLEAMVRNHTLSYEDLTNGICAEYEPTVIRLEATLTELLKNQEVVIDSLEEENRRFTEVELESQQLEAMVEKTKFYIAKLSTIKKDMVSLQDRASRLRKRAVKLQGAKQKEAQQKEKEAERERMLLAKMTRSTSGKLSEDQGT